MNGDADAVMQVVLDNNDDDEICAEQPEELEERRLRKLNRAPDWSALSRLTRLLHPQVRHARWPFATSPSRARQR